MNNSENGFAGATWGEKDGKIQRIHFIEDFQNPDGNLNIAGKGSIPVRVIFVNETLATAYQTPTLSSVKKSWGNFQPIGDFIIPLPPSGQ